jgi:hypothetical protein
MTSKKTSSVAATAATPFDAKADAARKKAVEKLLKTLAEAGLPPRDARFGLENTLIAVPAKGGLVRVDLSRADPSDLLPIMFDAVWKAGLDAGVAREREDSADAIMDAFPALKDRFEKIAEECIARDRASSRGYGEE